MKLEKKGSELFKRENSSDPFFSSSTDRLLFDGTYYYQYDAAGNRTARYVNSTDSGLDSNATDITIYSWNNANEITAAYYFATYSAYHSGAEKGDITD